MREATTAARLPAAVWFERPLLLSLCTSAAGLILHQPCLSLTPTICLADPPTLSTGERNGFVFSAEADIRRLLLERSAEGGLYIAVARVSKAFFADGRSEQRARRRRRRPAARQDSAGQLRSRSLHRTAPRRLLFKPSPPTPLLLGAAHRTSATAPRSRS